MKLTRLYKDNNHAFQQAGYTCGPVTLLNILRQKGDNTHTEEDIAQTCHAVQGQGTTNDNLIKAAESFRLKIVETKADARAEDIERHVDQGNYVVVNYFYAFSGEGHYAEIADYDERAFYLIDPTAGYMRIRKEYFVNYWYNHDKTIAKWFLAVA